MDFSLNEQQEMMQSLARDFLADEYTDKVLKTSVAEDEHNPELWKKVAALNLTGLGIPEEYGGVGDFLDLAVVLEEMGRACFISPFFSSVVLGASTILEAGNETQKQQYFPDIAEGKSIFTLAVTEESGRYSPEDIETTAVRQGNGYVINGRKVFVPDARASDYLICATRTGQESGITLLILDINTNGIKINPLTMVSGDKMSEVLLDNVEVGPEALLPCLNCQAAPMPPLTRSAIPARSSAPPSIAVGTPTWSIGKRTAAGHGRLTTSPPFPSWPTP